MEMAKCNQLFNEEKKFNQADFSQLVWHEMQTKKQRYKQHFSMFYMVGSSMSHFSLLHVWGSHTKFCCGNFVFLAPMER